MFTSLLLHGGFWGLEAGNVFFSSYPIKIELVSDTLKGLYAWTTNRLPRMEVPVTQGLIFSICLPRAVMVAFQSHSDAICARPSKTMIHRALFKGALTTLPIQDYRNHILVSFCPSVTHLDLLCTLPASPSQLSSCGYPAIAKWFFLLAQEKHHQEGWAHGQIHCLMVCKAKEK